MVLCILLHFKLLKIAKMRCAKRQTTKMKLHSVEPFKKFLTYAPSGDGRLSATLINIMYVTN